MPPLESAGDAGLFPATGGVQAGPATAGPNETIEETFVRLREISLETLYTVRMVFTMVITGVIGG